MDKTNLYSAEKAREDWEAKANEKEAHVDEKKILIVLTGIETQIHKLEIHSKNGSIGYKEYIYSGHLSPGEQKFIRELGYKVSYEDEGGMAGSFFRISW